MSTARGLRLALLVLGALAGLILVAVFVSAATDRPAEVVVVRSTVDGSKADVWKALTDFGAYGDWNPVITSASGEAREGGELDLEVELPGQSPESLDAVVLSVREGRKLRWQDRLVLPGVRDWEYELFLDPAGGGRVLVVQELRIEGLLAPFADVDAVRAGLRLMAEALEQRLGGR